MPIANPPPRSEVQWLTVDAAHVGQRIDNFLLRELKGVPKSRIYRLLRKGEVRVNKARVKAEYKLQVGDTVRLPPLRMAVVSEGEVSVSKELAARLEQAVVFEDDALIVINKPSGLAVHGGSGISAGLIEMLRSMRPDEHQLELVHRLDRETSGLVMVAKKRQAMKALHAALREGRIEKKYLALACGRWPTRKQRVDVGLEKFTLKSGERMVKPSLEGKPSETRFAVIERFAGATLIECRPITGRTHQIRVHALYAGYPLLGDSKYGNEAANDQFGAYGLKRLFLHAAALRLPWQGRDLYLEIPLDPVLVAVLDCLRADGIAPP